MSDMGTLTLVEFLTAMLDADEALATNHGQLTGDRWTALEVSPAHVTWEVVCAGGGLVAQTEMVVARHIARHDPARVLREVEAKRRIIESRPGIDAPGHMLDVVHDEVQRQREYVLRLLALPYADHPSYREEWRP